MLDLGLKLEDDRQSRRPGATAADNKSWRRPIAADGGARVVAVLAAVVWVGMSGRQSPPGAPPSMAGRWLLLGLRAGRDADRVSMSSHPGEPVYEMRMSCSRAATSGEPV